MKESFWPDGSVRERWAEIMGEDGSKIKHGPFRSWYESGLLHEDGSFQRGRKQGVWTVWYDGEPRVRLMVGEYLEGEMHGRWQYWMNPSHAHMRHMTTDSADASMSDHSENGAHPPPTKQAEYSHGLPHGVWISWHANGQTADSFAYEKGALDGHNVSYHSNGVLAAEAEFQAGKLIGSQKFFDESGALVREVK